MVNELLNRANEEFLKELPCYALAQAYGTRAGTREQDLEMATVDYLMSLQLFSIGEPNEIAEVKNVRNLMLNTLKALCVTKGLLDADSGSLASGGEATNAREPDDFAPANSV
ncbi:hypothetical protein MSAN_00972200 [Mycena sanguinolenta]|uniref:Uncharacterized protein n=1 Tax=Mycena sanguinolenta TaxID=230812 RepID=A0A8H6YU03_9AGAR|nr:hypothetical protein MSAN_00972200 [Mycena sanguinolenta]